MNGISQHGPEIRIIGLRLFLTFV